MYSKYELERFAANAAGKKPVEMATFTIDSGSVLRTDTPQALHELEAQDHAARELYRQREGVSNQPRHQRQPERAGISLDHQPVSNEDDYEERDLTYSGDEDAPGQSARAVPVEQVRECNSIDSILELYDQDGPLY